MHFAIGRRRQFVDSLECLVETALFLISALQRDRLDGVVRFDQALRGAFEPLMDDISVDGGVDQVAETELELFAVDGELPAETLDGMMRVKVVLEILPDFFDQLCVSSFHRS